MSSESQSDLPGAVFVGASIRTCRSWNLVQEAGGKSQEGPCDMWSSLMPCDLW
jgi:hypothetical protein